MNQARNTSESSVVCEALEPRLLLSSTTTLPTIEPLNFADAPAYISVDLLPDFEKQDDGIVASDLRQAQEAIEDSLLENPNADLSSLSSWSVRVNQSGALHVYVHVNQLNDSIVKSLQEVGLSLENSNADMRVVQGWVNHTLLDALAEVQGVRRIAPPAYAITNTGSITTAGDGILEADDLRSVMSVSGDGVKVGVISDGLDHWSDVDDTSDLPSYDTGITVHSTYSGSGDEGTAILEIVHDLASDADLYFAGMSGHTSSDMVTAIEWMVNQGCDVIVDDVLFFDEPMFEDGPIADAAQDAVDAGVVYVTAAGNSAERHYQADFDDHGDGSHEFASGKNVLRAVVAPGGKIRGQLQWSDEWGSSGNDYNLYLYQWIGSWSYVTGSTNTQDGNDDPLELTNWVENTGESSVLVGWFFDQYSGSDRELEFSMYGNGIWVYSYDEGIITPEDSIYGHAAVEDVITVGAVDASDSGNDDVEAFSSRGPSTIYTNFATQTSEPLNTLDVCGIDGVYTKVGDLEFFGDPDRDWKFYGTSAAAPHIAGIAALLLEIDSTLTPAQVEDLINGNAQDIGDAGYDQVSGYGRADALATVTAAATDVDLVAGWDTGASSSDNITSPLLTPDGQLRFNVTGTIEDATVTLYANGADIGSETGSAGSTIVTTENISALNDDDYQITSRQTVDGKLPSDNSEALGVTVDTAAPEVEGSPEINDVATQRDSIKSIEFTFTEDVSVASGDLAVYWHDGADWEQTNLSSPNFSQPSNNTARWENSDGLLTVDDVHLMARLVSGGVEDIAGNALPTNEELGEDLFGFHKLSGDVDGDKEQSSADIDTLFSHEGDAAYDLTGDDQTDQDDVDELVEQIFGTFFGDHDTDGDVWDDGLSILLSNWNETGMVWKDGDFTGDGTVDDADLSLLLANFGQYNPDFEFIDLGDPPVW